MAGSGSREVLFRTIRTAATRVRPVAIDANGNYENWHDPDEPNNAEGDGYEDCLEFKGFEIAPVKAWNDVACGVRHRFSLVEATVPTIHIGTCDTKVADVVRADFATGECFYEFQDAYDDCVESSQHWRKVE